MSTIRTPWFYYVHMPKCGGTFIATALQAMGVAESVAGDDGADAHLPACRIPRDGRPIVGSLRDPWSWYASLEAYWGQSEVGRAWLRPYREAARREEGSTIGAMAFPVLSGVRPVGIRPPPEETIAGDGWSLYAWNVVRAFCAEDSLYVATSRLDACWNDYSLTDYMLDGSRPVPALRSLFRTIGVDPGPSAWRAAEECGRRNGSGPHGPIEPDLARAIGRRDGWIARRYGMDRQGRRGRVLYARP
jgi:hypothetical protein